MSKGKVWPKSRRNELRELLALLGTIQSINYGSNAVSKILLSERLARRLTESNIANGRKSFTQFLIERAMGDESK